MWRPSPRQFPATWIMCFGPNLALMFLPCAPALSRWNVPYLGS